MSQTTTYPAARAGTTGQPGALMHLVAAGLNRSGIGAGVGLVPLADESCLPVICPGARCTLTVPDGGPLIWEWHPDAGEQMDPKLLADMACALLTGQVGEWPRLGDGYGRPRVTLKGAVGRELAARGLAVDLELYPDTVFFDVYADIVAAWLGSDLDARVRVTDDGGLSWECACAAWPADLAELAAAIVARVTTALAMAAAGPQRPGGSPLDEEKIITAYQGGWTLQRCAQEFGTSSPTVLGILRRHHVPTRTRGRPANLGAAAEQAMVAAYRDHQVTMQQCADWFGIGRDTARRILQQHEVAIRPPRTRSGGADPAQVIDFPRQDKRASRAGGTTKMLAPATELAVIAAYREQRLTMQQCADRFGISRGTVKRTLQRYQVPARPKGRHYGSRPGQAQPPAAASAGRTQPAGPGAAEPVTGSGPDHGLHTSAGASAELRAPAARAPQRCYLDDPALPAAAGGGDDDRPPTTGPPPAARTETGVPALAGRGHG